MVWPTNNSNTLWGKEKKETQRERKMLKGKIIHEERSRPQKEIAQCGQELQGDQYYEECSIELEFGKI